MPDKVADASTLGAILFQEPGAAKAAELLKGSFLCEPTILAYELARIAQKKISLYPKEQDHILHALMLGLSMDIRWVEVDHSETVAIALETGLTTYDAAYLHTAKFCGADLVTFDERLAKAMKH
ncbi:MAG: type II toxin-antitoxin system VapC family toxin [Elusimicrobia bacterium]|nr:type II toxin-antitoxin system VapC family toxin [Elusimicrobiota bacterium]